MKFLITGGTGNIGSFLIEEILSKIESEKNKPSNANILKDKNINPMPIDTTHIPNDHLQYAITWFSLAIIWALMSCLFVWTTRRKRL